MPTTLQYRDFYKNLSRDDSSGKYWGEQAAGCIFISKNTGRILLSLRSDMVEEGGTWGTWGGKIDSNENPKEAMQREVEEETGVEGDYKITHLYTYKDGSFKYYNYAAIVQWEFTPQLNWESDSSAWVEYGDWPTPLHFGLAQLIRHAGHKIKQIVDVIKKSTRQVTEAADVPAMATHHAVTNQAISQDFVNYIKNQENPHKVGYSNGLWKPHKSAEGGLPTIAYGHKIKSQRELEAYKNGITDQQAEALLKKDLKIASHIVTKYHKKWVDNYLKKAKARIAKKDPNDKLLQFFSGVNVNSPIFTLDQQQMEMLLDFAFNSGTLQKFPKMADAVFRHDWPTASKEYKRNYKTPSGEKKELTQRNKAYHNRFLREYVDKELHKIGFDPNDETSEMPIDWEKSDIQMGKKWDIPTLREFMGLPKTFTAIYPAIMEVNELEYGLAEEDPDLPEDERGGYDWSEFQTSVRRGVPPIIVVRDEIGWVSLADGNHRLKWATDAGYKTIGAWVVDKFLQKTIDKKALTEVMEESGGQYFELMGMRFDIDTAVALIKKKGLKASNVNIKGYAEKTLALDRTRPEHKPQSFFAHIDWDYLEGIPEDRLKEAGIIATIRTPDKKVYSVVIDGNHRLAKNYMQGRDTMSMYTLDEKDTKKVMM